MQEGMSKEEAYRRAYREHAERKLLTETLSIREQTELQQRLKRLGYSDDFLIKAVYDIHDAQYHNKWWGKKNPITVTVAADGTVVVSKNNGIIGKNSRARVNALFGPDAIIVKGRNQNYDNSRWRFNTAEPKHAEARGLQALLSRNIDLSGTRQATTLRACRHCRNLQTNWTNYYTYWGLEGIYNLTG